MGIGSGVSLGNTTGLRGANAHNEPLERGLIPKLPDVSNAGAEHVVGYRRRQATKATRLQRLVRTAVPEALHEAAAWEDVAAAWIRAAVRAALH
jgi:hypothetical protein